MISNEAYVFSGALVGFLLGLTGVGGGALMTPILLLFFNVEPLTAVATDLWFAAITKIAGAVIHHNARQVDWQIAKLLWKGSLPIAILGAIFLNIGGGINKISWLNEAIAVIVILTAAGMLFAPRLLKIARNSRISHSEIFKARQPKLTIVSGAVIGLCVTVTSIGAGALGSVFLSYLYPLRMVPHRLVATDLVHAIPVALIAGMGYLIADLINWNMLLSLLAGSVPAVVLSSLLARKVKGRWIQIVLAIVLLISGLKILI